MNRTRVVNALILLVLAFNVAFWFLAGTWQTIVIVGSTAATASYIVLTAPWRNWG
jgi:hypothetical protein